MSASRTEPAEASWPEVRTEFERLLEMPPEEQQGHLLRLGADRPSLAERLRNLLAGAASRVLQPADPLASVARELSAPPLHRGGERIGRFTIVRLLGVGGMGVVYEARDPTLKRTVALKLIHAALASADYVRRFEREAYALARLRHPGIAQVYETGSIESGPLGTAPGCTPYIALEFIPDARPLSAEGLAFAELVERFLAVLDAVQHAHEHGVIHCDLKPANILLDRAGHPKLIDFGVARLGAHLDTMSAGTAGTLRYMSPERCSVRVGASYVEPGSADTRADTFALGVILYELVEGRSPYACIDGSIGDLLDAVRSGAVMRPELRAVPQVMRRDLQAILAQAMAADPGARYSSVAGLADDLRRLLRHEAVAAHPPTLLREVRLMARRNRVAVGAAGVVAAALCVGAVAATIGLIQARRAGAEARFEVERSQRVIRFLGSTFNSVSPELLEAAVSAEGGPDLMTRWLQTGAAFGQARRVGREAGLVDVLLHAAGQLSVQFADDPLLEAQVAIDLARSLRTVGYGVESAALAARALELRRTHLPADHEDTLRALVFSALYARPEGDPRPDLASEALRGVEARFGRWDPRWFELRRRVVDAVAEAGGAEAGVAEAERAIAECTALFGAESRPLRDLEFRRAYYRAQSPGAREEDLPRAEDALRRMIDSDGGLTRPTAEAMFRVGMLNLERDPVRAETIFRDCLEVAPRFQGEANTFCYELRTRLYEALLRQHRLEEAESVAREQVERVRGSMGEASYYTVKAKARLARVLTWSASLGRSAGLDEAEQLAREAAIDGVRFDEKSPGGNYDAYFRGIWAQALVLRGDAPSIRLADQVLAETFEARPAVSRAPWCDAFLWLTMAQLRRAQDRRPDALAAITSARAALRELNDPGHPIARTLLDIEASGNAASGLDRR